MTKQIIEMNDFLQQNGASGASYCKACQKGEPCRLAQSHAAKECLHDAAVLIENQRVRLDIAQHAMVQACDQIQDLDMDPIQFVPIQEVLWDFLTDDTVLSTLDRCAIMILEYKKNKEETYRVLSSLNQVPQMDGTVAAEIACIILRERKRAGQKPEYHVLNNQMDPCEMKTTEKMFYGYYQWEKEVYDREDARSELLTYLNGFYDGAEDLSQGKFLRCAEKNQSILSFMDKAIDAGIDAGFCLGLKQNRTHPAVMLFESAVRAGIVYQDGMFLLCELSADFDGVHRLVGQFDSEAQALDFLRFMQEKEDSTPGLYLFVPVSISEIMVICYDGEGWCQTKFEDTGLQSSIPKPKNYETMKQSQKRFWEHVIRAGLGG